jgi:phenylacetate-CoA ligase
VSDDRLGGMQGDVPGALWPTVFSTRRSSLVALLHELDRTQWLSPGVIEAGQLRQLRHLAAHFEAHVPRFRARLAAAGLSAADLDTRARLSALPPLGRRELQQDPDSLYSPVLPEGHAPRQLFQTSGSTGEPVRVVKTALNQLFWTALTLRYHLWHEPDFSGRLCAIRALARRAGEANSWGPPFSDLLPTGPSLIIDNKTDVAEQIDRLLRFRPDSLIIYPTNLAAMMKRVDAIPGLKRVRTIGETLAPALRAEAEARLGVTVRDCYSSEEAGYLALECPMGGLYHIMSESLLVEVVDEAGAPVGAGEVGRVLVTDLHNYATPLIRYAIGDHAEMGPPCPCGRGLPTFRRILGRTRNMVRRPDGSTYWPITGFKKFRDLAPIVQYQLVQDSLSCIEVRLVVEQPLTPEQEARVAAHICDFLGWPFATRFRYFDEHIPTGPNGKFEEFKSLVGQS